MKSFNYVLLLVALTASIRFNGFAQTPEKTMYAHYIDVGQGQAILMEFPHGAILIDAGGQSDHVTRLITYLTKFFTRRADLHNTLNSVIITHQHVDHNTGLDEVEQNFKILNYIDNGKRVVTPMEVNQIWMEDHVAQFGIRYEKISFDKITANHNLAGYTDDEIDPVTGPEIDPQIIVYSGAFDQIPDHWNPVADYGNPNNHSLVIKVLFGQASFLFSGDLEEKGIKKVLDYYLGTNVLHADVLQVGHHGSKNATTAAWLDAVSPKYAVISCGLWKDGRLAGGRAKPFTTYAYAHPNKKAIDLLEGKLPILRSQPVTDTIGVTGSFHGSIPTFTVATMSHVYATTWDGNIVVKATADAQYTILTHN